MSLFLVPFFWSALDKLVLNASCCENLFQKVYHDYNVSVGSWEQKSAVASSLEYYGCPYRDGQGSCSDSHLNMVNSYIWSSQHPELSLSTLEAALPFLGGRTIGFIGDSMARQQSSSFLCMVWARVGNATRRIGDSPDSITYVFDIGNYTSGSSRSSAQSALLKVRWVRSNLGGADKLLEGAPLDYIVINIGHHLDLTKLGATSDWLKQYQKALLAALKGMDAKAKVWKEWEGFKGMPVVLLMTNVLRHFEDGDYDTIPRGHCNRKHPLSGSDLLGFRDSYHCHLQGRVLQRVVKQHYSNIRLASINSAILSWARADAHHTSDDCSHWCQPGLPDSWNGLICNFIKLSNTVGIC